MPSQKKKYSLSPRCVSVCVCVYMPMHILVYAQKCDYKDITVVTPMG